MSQAGTAPSVANAPGTAPPSAPPPAESPAVDSASSDGDPNKSLERLYDYTKFHIGAYLTLTGSYLTAIGLNISDKPLLHVSGTLAALAVVCFVIAGMAGGVIASSLTQVGSGTSAEFLETRIGPWGAQRFKGKARKWTYWEHTAFWVGLVLAALSFPVGNACHRQEGSNAFCSALFAGVAPTKSLGQRSAEPQSTAPASGGPSR